jgi:hypothetical protein
MDEQFILTSVALAGLVWLDVTAVRSAIRASIYSRVQIMAQALLTILFPVVGALLVIYLARGEDNSAPETRPDARTEPENVRVQNPNYEDV